MALWIESHVDLGGHKKLFNLCRELRIDAPTAVGHLHFLWWWTIQNRAEDRDLIGMFPIDIARAAKWEKNPERFVKALKKCGFIENSRIKDWMDYAGHFLKARDRKRTFQERSKNVQRTEKERPTTTQPDRTITVSTKNQEKTGFLSPKDEKIIRQDIANTNGVAPESEAAGVRLDEIVEEIAKAKDVKNPVGLARHKARNQ